uniref:Uncharacterized protein n=1 Tax=Calcidiscus leptoporus TaxID=127549 RepID=A0A7S0P5L8_9EUKA|mmetsp:Transcript_7618/g.17809  ORF Transcript_7618/g.17809 Transcript_7618/m.17809 type:complete len:845 (+) Transcript_7618:166-2700(+)
MGCSSSKDDGVASGQYDAQESAASRALNEALEKQQREESAIVKLLVLGTGESGKSTVFKQMKILYSVPDPPSKFIMVVRANLYGNAQSVHLGMEKLHIAYATAEGRAAGELIMSKPADGNIDAEPELVKAFQTMGDDAGVKEAIERASEYQLYDSTSYFWGRYADILKPDYLPTEQDVLRARVRTTGIVQQNFQIKDKKYTMFDVGGQRNERRKWIHCFDNVTAVIFVTAISEFDQVLYEDENTNRMDEALLLFDQICNHPSFKKTSIILFLNKRDIFASKLLKKDMTCWDPDCDAGQDYDKAVDYIKMKFSGKNKDTATRQVYAHATCATDTQNISIIMDSVFDIILKENLRKMDAVDIDKMMSSTATGSKSAVKFPPTYMQGTVLLCSCQFTDSLKERNVLVLKDNIGMLPAVEVQTGKVKQDSPEFNWVMSLGKNLPVLASLPSEVGSFEGNFKEAAAQLREALGGVTDLGFVYDEPIYLEAAQITLIVCVKACAHSSPPASAKVALAWKEHEEFENEHYKKYLGVDTDKAPCKPPDKNQEFNPFAACPVGFRWFKGVTLYTKQVNKTPTKGVYLGILRVVSTPSGFKIMVNEHNRIMIPLIFISSTQLSEEAVKWVHGVRVRWSRGIKLLQGQKPNRAWLGPEVSGEEGATVAEKLWWAIDEAKARLGSDSLGEFYDFELIDVDEASNMQLILFASLARNEKEVLDGHVWIDRQFLEVQNMKYLCPTVLEGLLKQQAQMVDKYQAIDTSEADSDMEAVSRKRSEKKRLKASIEANVKATQPLKWLNRTILWSADKMPSFADAVPSKDDLSVDELVEAAVKANTATAATRVDRAKLIAQYK